MVFLKLIQVLPVVLQKEVMVVVQRFLRSQWLEDLEDKLVGALVLIMMENIFILIIITIILTAKTYLLMDKQVGTMIQMEPIIKQEPHT